MGVIESEFLVNHFENLVQVVVSASPIPVPTFPILGSDRLVASLSWTSLSVADPPPGLEPPLGFILARAVLRIGHASITELTGDAAAMTFTDGTAWLFVGVSSTPHRLTMDIARIDIPGRPQSALFSPPLPLAKQPTTIDLPSGVVAVGQAILVADDVCTVRFITSNDENLFAPPANRGNAVSEGWAIHISGQVIAEQLRKQLHDALQNLSADIEVETQPYASWTYGFAGVTPLGWGAFGGFGVKKVDACADVDISIDVSASVLLSADKNAGTLTTRLQISSDASDWDSFRCWLAKGGLVAAALLPPLGIDSLAAVGMGIRTQAGEALTGHAPGGDWKTVSSGDTSATYEMVSKLPDQGPTSNIGNDPTIDAAGLVVSGDINPIPVAVHAQPHFTPNGGIINGAWVGGFSCKKNQWVQTYELPYIQIIDQALVGSVAFARLPVKVFPTSRAAPTSLWSLEVVGGGFDESVNIVCHASATSHHAASPFHTPPALQSQPSGFAFIHTSAGLKRFDLGPIPASRTPPDETQLIPMRVNCRNFGRDWVDPRVVAKWLVDPPELDFGRPALRQWQLTMSEVPRGANIVVSGYRNGELVQPLAKVSASETGPVSIEIVTDRETELVIDHTLSKAPAGARLTQRWLLPTAVADFHGTATGLVQNGDNVHVVGADRLVSLSTVTGHVGRADPGSATPFSLTLADGKVAAIYGNSLVIAIPHGGAAARAVRQL
jgi:hypothetical protein